MRRLLLAATAAAGSLFALGAAHAATYVLHASKWGAAQDRAVAKAGGRVVSSHAEAGVATVESNSPGFLAAARASGAILGGALDQVVEWTRPMAVTDASVNPLDDRFYATIQWAPQSIGAPAAWAAGYTGAGVRVAVIDGGIFNTHPDLAGAVDAASSISFVEPVAGDTAAANACRTAFNCDTGTFWHGTHVAGIVAARDNTIGVVGIAPQATIVGVKALHSGSGTFSAVINAILYAAGPGDADIINMSLGAVFAKNEEGASELRHALKKAVDVASRTALVVVSTGNDAIQFDGNNLTSVPAESGDVVAVSATGPIGFAYGATNFAQVSSYTNYGNSLVTIAGPGGNDMYPGNEACTLPTTTTPVTIPCWAFDLVLSTSRAGYTWAEGTSMAAPAVSAVAALVKQKHPGMTPHQLRKQLTKSATNMGPASGVFYGAGYVNAAAAVAD